MIHYLYHHSYPARLEFRTYHDPASGEIACQNPETSHHFVFEDPTLTTGRYFTPEKQRCSFDVVIDAVQKHRKTSGPTHCNRSVEKGVEEMFLHLRMYALGDKYMIFRTTSDCLCVDLACLA